MYPVHRQSTPPRPSRTSASVGLGVRARRSSAAISIPGVHAPHWAPPQARNAAWSGDGPSSAASPSTVSTRRPVDLARGDEARADLLSVEPHGARPAVAGVAAHLGAGQAEVLAQHVDEAPPPVGPDLDVPAVDREPEGGVDDHGATSRSRRDLGDRAPDQRQRRVPPVVAGAADVVDRRQRGQVLHRRDGGERRAGPPPAELALEPAQPPRDRGARPDRDPRVDDDPARRPRATAATATIEITR